MSENIENNQESIQQRMAEDELQRLIGHAALRIDRGTEIEAEIAPDGSYRVIRVTPPETARAMVQIAAIYDEFGLTPEQIVEILIDHNHEKHEEVNRFTRSEGAYHADVGDIHQMINWGTPQIEHIENLETLQQAINIRNEVGPLPQDWDERRQKLEEIREQYGS